MMSCLSDWVIMLVVMADASVCVESGDCDFQFIPNDMRQSSRVKCSNKLKKIPRALKRNYMNVPGHYTAIVNLNDNDIKRILSEDIKGMHRVTNFFISRNQLMYIQGDALSSMRNLKQLDISHNQLTEINRTTFTDLYQLEQLIAQHNQIENIEDGSFAHLTKLSHLFLAFNKLKEIYYHTFQPIYQIQHLRLQENNIAYVQSTAFKENVKLLTLRIDSNNRMQIYRGTFDGLSQIQEVNLSGNPLKCLSLNEKLIDKFLVSNNEKLQQCPEDTRVVTKRKTSSLETTRSLSENMSSSVTSTLGKSKVHPKRGTRLAYLYIASASIAIFFISVIASASLYCYIKNKKTSHENKMNTRDSEGKNDMEDKKDAKNKKYSVKKKGTVERKGNVARNDIVSAPKISIYHRKKHRRSQRLINRPTRQSQGTLSQMKSRSKSYSRRSQKK